MAALFRISDNHWMAMDGTDLGINITNEEVKHCLVFDSGELVSKRYYGKRVNHTA